MERPSGVSSTDELIDSIVSTDKLIGNAFLALDVASCKNAARIMKVGTLALFLNNIIVW